MKGLNVQTITLKMYFHEVGKLIFFFIVDWPFKETESCCCSALLEACLPQTAKLCRESDYKWCSSGSVFTDTVI